MNEKFKRGISAVTAIAVFSLAVPSSLFARDDAALKRIQHNLKNTLKKSIGKNGVFGDALVSTNKQRNWHDKASNSYYMGSVYVRFSRPTPPPIIKVSAPQIQAGCSGINIKGMFVSILNLDQLSNMLQNAGASLAWGVAIALIYSLPGVANAFKMINTWAKRIQQILASMCQSGIALAQHFLSDDGTDKKQVAKSVNNHTPKPAKTMQQGEKGILTSMGISSISFDQNGVLSIDGSSKMNKKDTQDTLLNYIIAGLSNNMSLLGTLLTDLNTQGNGALFKKLIPGNAGTGVPILLKQIAIGANTSNAKGENVTPIEFNTLISDARVKGGENEQKKWKLIFILYSFISDAVGDIYINTDVYKQLSDLEDYLKNPDPKNQQDAAAQFLNPSNYPLLIAKAGSIHMSTKAQQLANLILYGNKNLTYDKLEIHNAVLAKMQQIGGTQQQTTVVLTKAKHIVDLTNLIGNWKGTEVAARCTAAKLLHENVNGVSLDTNSSKKSEISTQGTIDCKKVPYFVPNGLEKYEIIYANSPIEDRGKLRSLLINYLSAHYTEDMMNMLFASLSGASISLPNIKHISSGLKKENALAGAFTAAAKAKAKAKAKTADSKDKKSIQVKAINRAPATKSVDLIKIEDDYVNKIHIYLSQVRADVEKDVKKDSKSVTKDQLDHLFDEQAIKNKERGLRNAMAH